MNADIREKVAFIGSVLGIFAGISGLLLSLTAGRRGWRIISHFVFFELSDEPVFWLSVVGLTLVWWYLPALLLMWRGSHLLLSGILLKQLWARRWIQVVPLGISLTVVSLFYIPLRYRSFADVYFSREIRQAIKNRDLYGARSLCASYIALYPRKGLKGSAKDFACTIIMARAANLRPIFPYVRDYKPGPSKEIDTIQIPNAAATRDRALVLLAPWSSQDHHSKPK